MPTALIVEDEPEANKLLAMLVQLRGYETVSAYTGSEALEKVGQGRPDIVFLDLMLPDINGFDICRTIKSSRPTCLIPVVMVTARLAAENRLQGFRAGATDYVPKPYTPDQIFGAMATADAWSRDLAECPYQGSIPLDATGEVVHLREISRLWSLLLAKTSLTEEAVHGLDQYLVDLATRAVDWGRKHGKAVVATLGYSWDVDRVTITLRDESGWFCDDPPMRPEGLGGLFARALFDEVSINPTAGQVVMSTRFSPEALMTRGCSSGSGISDFKISNLRSPMTELE